jgi:hypothetical protein
MTAAAMIRVDEDLGPHQVSVVAHRHVHRKYPDRASRILRRVEIVLCRLEVPAVTHLPRQHFRNDSERVGVVNLARRLLDVGDCCDLAKVVGLDAYERHHTRVPHLAASCHAIFWELLAQCVLDSSARFARSVQWLASLAAMFAWCRRLRRIRRNNCVGEPALVLRRFVGSSCRSAARTSLARITPWSPPTSSSLADDKTCLLVPPQNGGAARSDARSSTKSRRHLAIARARVLQ